MSTVETKNTAMTRAEALRALGLYAKHDRVSGALATMLVIASVAHLFVGPHPLRAILLLLVAVVVLLQWLIILAYRVGTFVLDLHADVGLMPEAAARIAVAYLGGAQPPPPKTPDRHKA